MSKTIQDPLSVAIEAFRSGLLVLFGPLIALYLSTLSTSFVAWRLPDPVFLVASPLWNPIYWAFHLYLEWVWFPMLVQLSSLTAYTILPAIRFDLLLAIVLAGMYLNVLSYDAYELPGRISDGTMITTITPNLELTHRDRLRLGFATGAIVIFWGASIRAAPWKDREWDR